MNLLLNLLLKTIIIATFLTMLRGVSDIWNLPFICLFLNMDFQIDYNLVLSTHICARWSGHITMTDESTHLYGKTTDISCIFPSVLRCRFTLCKLPVDLHCVNYLYCNGLLLFLYILKLSVLLSHINNTMKISVYPYYMHYFLYYCY